MLKTLVTRISSRKGLDKPVFVIATIVLVLLFMAVYFGAVQEWFTSTVDKFTDKALSIG